MSDRLHVLVIGGGIGGLCLAQGLRQAGVDVSVYERDTARGSGWEGYCIQVNPAGSRALHACLPEALWQGFLGTAGPGGDFGFLTEQLKELVVVEESVMYPRGASDPAEGHYIIDRRALRRLLLSGLDDVVRFGAEFVHFEPTGDGRIAAIFADGSRAVGDVVVGADGTSSRLRRQYLPQARRTPAGVGGVGHRLALTPSARAWLPPRLLGGMNSVSVDAPVSLFTAVFDPPATAGETFERIAGPAPEGINDPYLLCALVADLSLLPADLMDLDTGGLQRVVDEIVTGWHPLLRRVLAESDPDARTALEFGAAEPVPPWPTSPVTVLGDAIHSMPPVGGLGANTALRDAHLLCRTLTAADRCRRPLLDAIAYYEREMRDYGFAAVASSLRMQQQSLTTGTLSTIAARSWFRLCRALSPVRRLTFAHGWEQLSSPRPWEQGP